MGAACSALNRSVGLEVEIPSLVTITSDMAIDHSARRSIERLGVDVIARGWVETGVVTFTHDLVKG
jgi:hypothetical protein